MQNFELPTLIKNSTSNEDLLWNDVLKTVTETCAFPKTEGPVCKTFITQLTETLWYIDGHAKTMKENLVEKFLKFS